MSIFSLHFVNEILTNFPKISKNYLYYLTADEMEEMDKINVKPFVTAHQSNIGIPKDLVYDFLGVTNPDESGKEHFLLNNYCEVFLVNDTL